VHYWADLQSVQGFRCYDNIEVCKLIALYTTNAHSAEREMSASTHTADRLHYTAAKAVQIYLLLFIVFFRNFSKTISLISHYQYIPVELLVFSLADAIVATDK